MTTEMELERVRWLIDHASRLAPGPNLLPRNGLTDWQLAILKQQQSLRKRSRLRFPDPDRWLWTDQSLSQASDHWCAQYKASLFPRDALVVDACCGAGSDLVALANRGETKGIDRDPALAALAEYNAAAHGYAVSVATSSLPEALPDETEWLHIDPDRRPTGTRMLDGDHFSPTIESVLNMSRDVRGAVIKLAPSTRMSEAWLAWVEAHTQRVWLGNMGECKQQLLLTGELTGPNQGWRTAVLSEPAMTADGQRTAVEPLVFTGQPGAVVTGSAPCKFIYDLHPVLHASDLHTAWANEQGLDFLGAPQGYFTSDFQLTSKWLQAFEVIDVIAWDDRKVRKWLRGYGAGPVEVKCRLHRMDASLFQRRYSRAQGTPVTLLVSCIGDRVQAVVAKRLLLSQNE